MHHGSMTHGLDEITLPQKVAFLSQPKSYPWSGGEVICRETHMSWVFLVGNTAYKLKKPVRFPYLDFSTLPQRESACRAELALNRRLAQDVYLGVVPLVASRIGLSVGGEGTVIDWLVVMRRLEESHTLEHAIRGGRVKMAQLRQLAATLVRFYRQARPVFTSPAVHLANWHHSLTLNRRVLLDRHLPIPFGRFRQADRVQRCFLSTMSKLLTDRVTERRIIDGHGDLRPEHIWLEDTIRIIDCLEFSAQLRAIDPLDEIAFLSLECERMGALWVGEFIRRHVTSTWRDGACEMLYRFYRSYRATLRARLAIAHLLEPNPRTPHKWRPLANGYLQIAAADSARLERLLKTREDR